MALYNEPRPNLIRDGEQPEIMEYSDEYWRTNTNLSKDQGRAPSFEKLADPRLPGLFSFEYGGQFGEVAIPKGRIVAVAADKQFEYLGDGKSYPAITLANGGVDTQEDVAEHYKKQHNLSDDKYIRVANKPVGVSTINVYQDKANSFQGNRPSFITRGSIEVPLFNDFEAASQMEWGSAYGELKAGDKVMSDETGRFVKWKEGKLRKEKHEVDTSNGYTIETDDLTFNLDVALYPAEDPIDEVKVWKEDGDELELIENSIAVENPHTGQIEIQDVDGSGDNAEIENGDTIHVRYRSILSNAEQMIGMVLCRHENLIPAGWLKWVYPDESIHTDFGDRYTTPTGLQPPLVDDAPVYDPTFGRFVKERPTGIPGILDGMNYVKEYSDSATGEYDGDPQVIGKLTASEDWEDEDKIRLRVKEHLLPITEITKLDFVDEDGNTLEDIDTNLDDFIIRKDVSEKYNVSGLIEIAVKNEGGDDLLDVMDTSGATDEGDKITVKMSFKARHQMPGMPTHMDWNGCVGSVDILLQL